MEGLLVRLRPVGAEDHRLLHAWAGFTTAGVLVSGGQSDAIGPDEWKAAIEGSDTTYAIIESRSGEPVGAVSWRTLAHDRSFEVGALVGHPGWWDSGAGLEGAMLLIDHLFGCERAHRIEMVAAGYNKRSLAFLAKGGISVDGVLRDYMFADGRHHDAVICSMTREEYLAPFDGYLPRTRLVPLDTEAEAMRILRRHLDSVGGGYLTGLLGRGGEGAGDEFR
jgi:RimJ/RimL family protein N-acetyltransferase